MLQTVLIVVVIRIALLFLPSYQVDMNTWKAWTIRLVEVGPANFYAPNYFSDYFPGYLYMLWFLGKSFSILPLQSSITSLNFEYYLKLFTNIFDVATGYYIYKIVSKYQKKLSLMAMTFYLLNPAIFFNSSIMGQVDGILTFFLVFSTYQLIELKKLYQWGITSSLALLIKPQGLAIFPVLLMTLFRDGFRWTKLYSLFIIPFFIIIFSLPFFIKDPVLGIFHLFQKSANVYPYTGMFTYNFWYFTGWWINDNTTLLGIPYRIIGISLYLFSLLLIITPLLKSKIRRDKSLTYFAISLSAISFFMFLTRMHERYLFPFFAFFVITALIRKSLSLTIIYVLFSTLHFVNLWYVYFYYNYVFTDSKSATFFIYDIVSKNSQAFSFVSIFFFLILFLIYYKNIIHILGDKNG